MITASVLPTERRLIRSRSCKKRSDFPLETNATPPNLKRTRTTTATTLVARDNDSASHRVVSTGLANRTLPAKSTKSMFDHQRRENSTGGSDKGHLLVANTVTQTESAQPSKRGRGRPRKVPIDSANGVVEKAPTIDGAITATGGRRAEALNEKPDGKSTAKRTVHKFDAVEATIDGSDMWTSKYAPSLFGTFVGNTSAVAALESWLQQWTSRSKATTSTYHDSSSSSGQGDDRLSNAIFIRGPPGVGKTSLVYYIAQRLGYKVLEVNSSSERSGRRVLADLHEATQSLHVEGTKVSAATAANGISSFFKPTLRAEPVATPPSTIDIQQPVQRQLKAIRKRRAKSSTPPTSCTTPNGKISFFFSPSRPATNPVEVVEILDESSSGDESRSADKISPSTSKSSIKSFFKAVDKRRPVEPVVKGQNASLASSGTADARSRLGSPEDNDNNNNNNNNNSQRIKCSKSTIILFDDVDVIFDDDGDEGFWMALETVLRNSKKPCILTATRGYDAIVKRCRILQDTPVIELHRPSPTQVAGLLRRIGAVENRDLTDYNVEFVCQHFASDLRRALLQMEFETVAPGLPQTIHPVDKTLGALLATGCIDEAVSIQTVFKKSGFNAFYASLESCLPFEFEDIAMSRPSSGPLSPDRRSTPKLRRTSRRGSRTRLTPKAKSFGSAVLGDLGEIFDQLSEFDLVAGSLDMMGEECLPNYERAKRWMEQRPIETKDANPRMLEELLEIGSTVLLGGVAKPLERIAQRCAALNETEQHELHLPRVASSLGFRDIHKKLKKVHTNERALDDVLSHLPISRSLGTFYLFYLSRICKAEEERRDGPNQKRRNRFLHYLSQIRLYLTPEQIQRIATLW